MMTLITLGVPYPDMQLTVTDKKVSNDHTIPHDF